MQRGQTKRKTRLISAVYLQKEVSASTNVQITGIVNCIYIKVAHQPVKAC